MKITAFIAAAALFFAACQKHEQVDPTEPDPTAWELVSQKAAVYAAAGPEIFQVRCDNLTFKALWAAYAAVGDGPLDGLEWQSGEWHRDAEPCFPDDSKSEISRDGLIMLLHYIWQLKDTAALNRLWDYGVEHNWRMGNGPASLTDAKPLIPIMARMSKRLNEQPDGVPLLADPEAASLDEPFDSSWFDGFRGHLGVMYLWLAGSVRGSLSDIEFAYLKKAADESPENALFLAVYARYTDGDMGAAIAGLLDERFYPNYVTIETGTHGWGSCPNAVHFMTAFAAAAGK